MCSSLAMRSSRLHSEYLFRVDCEKLLRTSTHPVLATFTFAESVLNHSEAASRWLKVSRYLRAKGVRGIGVWQRQTKRGIKEGNLGAWHLHLVMNKPVYIGDLRDVAVNAGWGQFLNVRRIRLPEGKQQEHTFSKNGRGAWSVVGYLARYLTRDLQKDFGSQLVVRVGPNMRCGNVKFAWRDGASWVWRVGCSVAFGEGFLSRYSQVWQYRDQIFEWGRQKIFDDTCAWFDSVGVSLALAPAPC
jgi:hypothetical protein